MVWTWRPEAPDEEAVARWWRRGRLAWRALPGRARLATGAGLACAATAVAVLAFMVLAAVQALESPGGAPEATTMLASETSWVPPGTRSTVVIDGAPTEILQPWHSGAGDAVVLGLLAAGATAAALYVAVVAVLAALPHPATSRWENLQS